MSRRFGALIVGLILVPATAWAGTVNETVTSNLPGVSQGASQSNVENSTLQPLILEAANKDEGFSSASLSGTAGTATLSVHACSGPTGGDGGFFVGQAGGNASLDYTATYQVVSSTLPVGSPVFVNIVANALRRETVSLDYDPNDSSVNDLAGVSGDAHINFSVGSTGYSFLGTYFHTRDSFGNEQKNKTGLFNGLDSMQVMSVVGGTLQGGVVPAHVGDMIGVNVAGGLTSTSGALVGVEADADTQAVLNWGVSAAGGSDIQIITFGGGPTPPVGVTGFDPLLELLPPRPPTTDTPEPSTFILMMIGAAGAILGRRRTFALSLPSSGV